MAFRNIFPKAGGGWARRYMRFRKEFNAVIYATPNYYPYPPLRLFDFSDHDDAVDASLVHEQDKLGWRITSDKAIGGFSTSTAALIKSQDDLERFMAGEELEPISTRPEPRPEASDEDDVFVPFLRWKGRIDTTVGLQSDVQRSGYAAMRSPEFPFDGANLRGAYDHLEVVCRTDGRAYKVNVKISSFIPNCLYQGEIHAEASDHFIQFVLPFTGFRLNVSGREHDFPILDTEIRIETIGVALMDGKDGDFQFDLLRVRAVNFYEDKLFTGPPPKPE
jgi:Complex I intermediate-associated protein 30 (CIA30)